MEIEIYKHLKSFYGNLKNKYMYKINKKHRKLCKYVINNVLCYKLKDKTHGKLWEENKSE